MTIILEDDATIRSLLSIILADQRLQHVVTPNTRSANRALKLYKPKSFLVDFRLEAEDAGSSITLCKQLHPACRVILFTGLPNPIILDIRAQYPIDEVLPKPFDIEQLFKVLTIV